MKADFGGSFKFLRVDELHIESKYQRGKGVPLSRSIAGDIDMPAFGVLLVSKRKGAYFIIDGQRRGMAAKMAGIEFVPCMVWPDLPLKAEAKSYRRINFRRTKPSPVNEWVSGIAEEDETTLAAQKILTEYGFKVTGLKFSPTAAFVHIRCGGKMRDLYERGALEDTLHILTACWPKSKLISQASVIDAMGMFVRLVRKAENPDSPSKIMKRFKAMTPGMVEDRAHGFYRANIVRSMNRAYLMLFTTTYNKGRRSGTLEVRP